ncbi:MAG: hypothetical protein ACE5GH_04445 [Fidelibacterota bacterium]
MPTVPAATAAGSRENKKLTLQHPFQRLPNSIKKGAFLGLGALTLVLLVILNRLNTPLTTPAAPSGIISFELAGELSRTEAILESWGDTANIHAGFSLGLDYLFLVSYASFIALGCVLGAQTFPPGGLLALVGVFLAWLQFGAAVLDSVENFALIRLLLGDRHEGWPIVARWCALPKFAIVGAGAAYILLGAVAKVTKSPGTGEHSS